MFPFLIWSEVDKILQGPSFPYVLILKYKPHFWLSDTLIGTFPILNCLENIFPLTYGYYYAVICW